MRISMSSFTVKTAQGNCPYVGVPAFVSRAFRHTADLCADRPDQEAGRPQRQEIGVPEYQLTANVWARAILEDDHGVKPSDIHWIRGGTGGSWSAGKNQLSRCRTDVRLDNAPEGRTLSSMLEAGEIDGFVGPRVPPGSVGYAAMIGWLFPDPVAAAKDYFKRTGIFPIMHLVGVRRELAETSMVPGAVYKLSSIQEDGGGPIEDTSSTK